jgi:hypothetical protein
MAQTFDIRFARAGGIAAFLEEPANSFRWKGAGRLSIDPQGISIAVRRGLLWLFPRTRRVAAADLREVLREGEALRVEFATKDSPRAVVPFWVRDQGTAREIVRLLPTTRTVEMDHDAAGVVPPKFHFDWRALSLLGAALILVVSAVLLLQRSEPPLRTTVASDAAATPAADAPVASPGARSPVAPSASSGRNVAGSTPGRPAIDVPYPGARRAESDTVATHPSEFDAAPASATERRLADASASDQRTVERSLRPAARAQMVDGVVPIIPGMPAHEAARRELDRFRQEASLARSTGTDGWWRISVRIYNDPALNHSDLGALRDMELAVAMAWRHYLYVSGDPVAAESMLEFAERLEERLELYVR